MTVMMPRLYEDCLMDPWCLQEKKSYIISWMDLLAYNDVSFGFLLV